MGFVGTLIPDTGRRGNRMWAYAARHVRPLPDAAIDAGLEPSRCRRQSFLTHLTDPRCDHVLSFAAVMLAVLKGSFGTRTVV